jgi:hypothetical protein
VARHRICVFALITLLFPKLDQIVILRGKKAAPRQRGIHRQAAP